MTGEYHYSPDIWPPLLLAIFVAILGLYSWNRCDVPARKPFIVACAFGSLLLLGMACEAAAVTPAAHIAWIRFQAAMAMFGTAAETCFTLEYVDPGRWLRRRTLALLALLAIASIITLLAAMVYPQLIWRPLGLAAGESILSEYATPGAILALYFWFLGLVNAAVFLWLFVYSPLHRWPVAIMAGLNPSAARILNISATHRVCHFCQCGVAFLRLCPS